MPDSPEPSRVHAAPGPWPVPDPGFIASAHNYKAQLYEVTTPAQFHGLWRDTHLPYRIAAPDPHSPAYRAEVKAIYRALTGLDYDIGAELTSTKQDAIQFLTGYPWVADDLGVVAQELSKTVQAMQALHKVGATGRVIEFGAGWGNLALPLAKAGLGVTAVDIDSGFTRRLDRLAAEQHALVTTFDGSFLDAAATIPGPFETVIFQSSFHHCLDFDLLLATITGRLLDDGGRILFLSEPIIHDLAFPWGIRYDGEALWAVMTNGWLELGFQQDFFLELLFRHGLLPVRIPGLAGLVGDGWCASRAQHPVPFAELALPSKYDDTFHLVMGSAEWGRYCHRRSRLPGAGTTSCTLQLKNFGTRPMNIEFRSGGRTTAVRTIGAQQTETVTIPTAAADIDILSDVFIPNDLMGNGDTREIGIAILEVSWLKA